MKTIISFFVLLLLPLMASAYVNIDGIYYQLDSKTMTAMVHCGPTHPEEFVIIREYYYKGKIVIPKSVTYEGAKYTVTSIYGEYGEDGDYVGAFSDCSALTSITIPNSVTSIGEFAFFDCSGMVSITIPNSVTSIGGYAFSNCSSLTSITIPNSVTSIGGSAFSGCTGLTSVTIPNSMTSIGGAAFSGCTGLTFITIPNSVTSIGGAAFRDCTSLTSIAIGSGVTSIGQFAFSGCRCLTSITIPNSVTSIGYGAFIDTGWYSNQKDGLLYLDNWLLGYKGNKPTEAIAIADGTKGIAARAFSDCSGLTSITIPNSVTSIAGYAFYGCSGLTSVSIPNSVTSIADYAFYGCSGLNSVNIGSGVTSIGWSAFYGCQGLTSITIPNNVVSIGGYAFSGCRGLTSVTIGSGVTSIGLFVFSSCNSLKKVSINCLVVDSWFSGFSSIETVIIGNETKGILGSAFSKCTSLKTLTIGKSVNSIGASAFVNCSKIESVSSLIENPCWIDNSVFDYTIFTSTTLYVPKGKKLSYQNMPAWNLFSTIIEIDSENTDDDVKVEGYNLFGVDLQGMVDTKVILPIELTNEDEVKLCQFDLQLPAGVKVATMDNGKLDAKLTERAESHSVSSQQLSNGDYRFIVSSMDNDSFTGNSGALLEITLDVPASMEPGEYIIKVLNAEVSVPDGNDLKVVKPADTESKLIVKAYTPGDVNNDGAVSVTDVGCAINYILEQIPSVFNFDAADMNGDKSISVTDVGIIINYILNDGAFSPHRAPNRNYVDDTILPSLSLQPTEGGFELQLENKSDIVGFQFDVELRDNTAINDMQLNEAFRNDHLLNYRCLGNGKWRVVCYSLANSTFADNAEALLKISTSGDITISDIRLTTVGLDELRLAAIIGMSTEMANVEQGMQMIVRGRTFCITSDCDATLQLFTLGGSVYRTLHVRQGVNYINDLPAGIYLIDHKKIIIH